MELDELLQRIRNLERVQALADKPASEPEFTMQELKADNQFLRNLLREKDQKLDEIQQRLDMILKQQEASLRQQESSLRQQEALLSTISRLNETISRLEKEKSDLQSRLNVVNKEHYGSSKRQNGRKKSGGRDLDKDKNDFDGTLSSLDNGGSETAQPETSGKETEKCIIRPDRHDWKYNKESVEGYIEHKSDEMKLPEGAIILERKIKVVRDVVSKIVEHHFEILKYMTRDGKFHTGYFPKDNEEGTEKYKEIIPGTHVTANLLSYLIFNRYEMSTPANRETRRLSDMKWNTCRQNLLNWCDKGAVQLKKLLPALKAMAMQKGSNLNIDETWCRYKSYYGGIRKRYMWCLVNAKARIAIFFYGEDGGRSRNVLKDFLSDAKELKSIQSDGYNAYMYLDDELVDIEHLCCLAHARAKFWYAYEQGSDLARFFLEKIGALYGREEEYRKGNLTAEKIRENRNDSYTTNIINDIRLKMLDLLATEACEPGKLSDLMRRALNYLHTFWKQLFAYRNDGEYTIDNLVAERTIRNMTIQRKNSLFFCSDKGARNSAIYNTFITTCRQVGVSFGDYFRKLMKELGTGRTDYENLLPMTIGL